MSIGDKMKKIKENKKTEKRFVDIKEGCNMYSMAETKFREIVNRSGAKYKIDGKVFIKVEEFDKFLESFRVE